MRSRIEPFDAVPGAEQSTAAVARPPSTQGMKGCGALGANKRGGQDTDEGDRPVKRTKVDARRVAILWAGGIAKEPFKALCSPLLGVYGHSYTV